MPPPRFVSTGTMPAPEVAQALVDESYASAAGVTDGAVSEVYPALAAVDPDQLGVAVVTVDGRLIEAGSARHEFTMMSVAKPFVFALVAQTLGVENVRDRVGVNATGLPFNSVAAVERDPRGRTNPMVNSGAIATTSLTMGGSLGERWSLLLDGLSRCAGRRLSIVADVLNSARATNHRNRALAALLASTGGIDGDPLEAAELYTRQSCLGVTAFDLAVMGAMLADGGVNPLTQERVVDEAVARATLGVMMVAGLYETSGDWLLDVGMPGKSGIGGGIVTVSPGKGALGTFAPRLDAAGNSVQGQVVARFLSERLGLDLLASAPVD